MPLGRIKDILYSFYLCNLGWLLSAPIPVADETLMTAILPVGIPVSCELFSATFAGETIDRFWTLPDLVTVLAPPYSPAGFTAEASFPTGLRLHQKLAAVRANVVVCHHDLNRFLVSVQFIRSAVVAYGVPGKVELISNLTVPHTLRTENPDLFFLNNGHHAISSPFDRKLIPPGDTNK